MIKTIPTKGPSIFISYDDNPNSLEVFLNGKNYVKFDDMIDDTLGIHYVFANINENVDAIAKTFLEAQLITAKLEKAQAE
jgi:hypothetical protein